MVKFRASRRTSNPTYTDFLRTLVHSNYNDIMLHSLLYQIRKLKLSRDAAVWRDNRLPSKFKNLKLLKTHSTLELNESDASVQPVPQMDQETVSMGRRLPTSELQRIKPNNPLIPRQHRVSSYCAFELHLKYLNLSFWKKNPAFLVRRVWHQLLV